NGAGAGVYNNVVNGGQLGIQAKASTQNAKIYNNVVYGRPIAGIQVELGATTTITNNISTGNGSNIVNNSTGTTLTGTANVVVDPSFIDANGGDFHIPSTSAARGVGVKLPEVTVDIDGHARTDPYDAGVYMFTPGGGSPIPRAPTGFSLVSPQ